MNIYRLKVKSNKSSSECAINVFILFCLLSIQQIAANEAGLTALFSEKLHLQLETDVHNETNNV